MPAGAGGVKYFPPDVTACIFFLKNRMKEKYRDVQKHHHSGEVFQTSAELLVELRKDVLELMAEGIDILVCTENLDSNVLVMKSAEDPDR